MKKLNKLYFVSESENFLKKILRFGAKMVHVIVTGKFDVIVTGKFDGTCNCYLKV